LAPYRHCHPPALDPTRLLISLRSTPLESYTRQSAVLPNPDFICEMSGVQTTSHAILPIHRRPEVSPWAPEKKSSSFSVHSFLSWVRQHPFLISTATSLYLTGILALIMFSVYPWDGQDPYLRIPPNGSGVSGVIGPSRVLTDGISQVALVGNGYHLDQTTLDLSVAWEVMGCGEYRLRTYVPTGIVGIAGCGSPDRAMDIYFLR